MYRTHTVDILVGGERVDIYSQRELNLRMNSEIYDPGEVSTTQGDYSFEFELPATERNCRIFGYSNVFDGTGKFTRVYNSQIVADGVTVFDGTLRLSATETGKFYCNLVLSQGLDVEGIFGETVMNSLRWTIPFSGTSDMSVLNADMDSDVYFPFVSYGAFQKVPKQTYTIGSGDYTDLHTLDAATTRYYWENFPPSLRMNELVRRLFEYKGYTVSGTAFEDATLNGIYLSTRMTDKQDPYYPAGNNSIGRCSVSSSMTSAMFYADTDANRTRLSSLPRTKQSLTYPTDAWLYKTDDAGNYTNFNFENAFVYDAWSFHGDGKYDDGHSRATTNASGSQYMWRDGCVYIPASGYYKVQLYTTMSINESSENGKGYYTKRWVSETEKNYVQGHAAGGFTSEMKADLTWCPIEVQIVRNSDRVELCRKRNPDLWLDMSFLSGDMYPHEEGWIREKDQITAAARARSGRTGAVSGAVNTSPRTNQVYTTPYSVTMAYDPYVNPNFVIGTSTLQQGGAVIKNGKSWNAKCTDVNSSRCNIAGYNRIRRTDSTLDSTSYIWNTVVDYNTEYNRNSLSTPYTDYYTQNDNNTSVNARTSAVVWLEKGDVLRQKVVTKQQYRKVCITGTSCKESDMATGEMDMSWYVYSTFNIEAITPDKSIYGNLGETAPLDPSTKMKRDGFGFDLNVGQWLSSEEKMADFVKNWMETFNLRATVDGSSVRIDTQRLDIGEPHSAVDISDRVDIRDCKNVRIDYPRSLEVKFDIDDEEAGFYKSVPEDKLELGNWKEFGDRGSEEIALGSDDTAESKSVESKFSYTWYDTFQVDMLRFIDGGTQSTTATVEIPLICKDEHFIIQNDEAMQHDGLSLKQRMWFRQKPFTMNDYGGLTTPFRVKMWDGTLFTVSLPANSDGTTELDFRDTRTSLLRRYFNVTAHVAGNLVECEAYITPQEYMRLRSGARCIVGGAETIVCKIEGYDPTGYNPAELTLLRIT